ncbi:MAG TPA: hybrid sensor histidine kinase/response regulator [Burkholderiaceae bacterium]|nr:hybrid sensor histidine kinase/response regulator [Burkholderiaceae bacterium]
MSGPLTRFGLAVETAEQRKEKILAGVMAAVYRQVPQSVLVSVVGAFALVMVLWHSMNQAALMAWFMLILVESLARVRVAYKFRHAVEVVDEVQRWARRWVALAALAGLLWGTAGFIFFSNDQPLHQVVLVAVVLSVAFGSLTLYASHPPAFYSFMLLAVMPLIARMVWEQDPTYYTAAVVMAAVFFFTVFYGRNFGDAVFESVKNNYENEVLVDQLMVEKRLAEDARREAENATRSKTQFFAAASHDLRQPLQAIGIYVSLLKKRATGPLEPLVNNMSTAVESLSKLVEELLEISRLDSGSIQPKVDQVSLDEMFSLLEQEFTPLAASKGLSLRVRRSGHAADSDPMLLQRVIRNLLANAIRYTQRGGVLLAARARGGLISVEVWDTGPGIKQGEVDRIFEEFYRGESSKAENSGTGFGLGLSIVRRICGLLGHPLIVTTRPGTGTVFRVEVPLSVAPLRTKRSAPETMDMVLRSLEGHTFVLLEDNAEILNSLTRLVRSWDAQVIPSTGFNAQLIKEISLHERIDGVLADHNLGPHSISGVESVFRIRELVGSPVPVVMLTAVQAAEVVADFQRAMEARMALNPALTPALARSRTEEPPVLQKPTSPAVLNATLAEALGLVTTFPVVQPPELDGHATGATGHPPLK